MLKHMHCACKISPCDKLFNPDNADKFEIDRPSYILYCLQGFHPSTKMAARNNR